MISVIDKKQMYDSVIMGEKCFQGVELYYINVSDEFKCLFYVWLCMYYVYMP